MMEVNKYAIFVFELDECFFFIEILLVSVQKTLMLHQSSPQFADGIISHNKTHNKYAKYDIMLSIKSKVYG